MPNIAYSASQKRKRKSSFLIILSVFSVLIIDQISKAVISSKLSVGQSIPIIKDILHITFIKNTGAAFGLFKNSIYFFIAVSVVAVFIIGGILLKAVKNDKFFQNFIFNFGLILIMSGAIGNLIDRIRLRYVIDFIDVRIWPIFNFSDISITIGTTLLIIYFALFDKKKNV
jgi:signal peptidase II